MNAALDLDSIAKLKLEIGDSDYHSLRIQLDTDESWLHIDAFFKDYDDRTINYNCTFPLEEWILQEIKDVMSVGGVPCWGTNYDAIDEDSDEQCRLRVTDAEGEHRFFGPGKDTRRYDAFRRRTVSLIVEMSRRIDTDPYGLKSVYMRADPKLDNDTFELDEKRILANMNGEKGSVCYDPEYLDRIRSILGDYSLRPDELWNSEAYDCNEGVYISLGYRYGNLLHLTWGKDRPDWVDDMTRRLHGAMKSAYLDGKIADSPSMHGEPDPHLSDSTRRIILEAVHKAERELPIEYGELREIQVIVVERRDAMLRRLCVGKPVDMEELEIYTKAAEEMESLVPCFFEMDWVNEILEEK